MQTKKFNWNQVLHDACVADKSELISDNAMYEATGSDNITTVYFSCRHLEEYRLGVGYPPPKNEAALKEWRKKAWSNDTPSVGMRFFSYRVNMSHAEDMENVQKFCEWHDNLRLKATYDKTTEQLSVEFELPSYATEFFGEHFDEVEKIALYAVERELIQGQSVYDWEDEDGNTYRHSSGL